MKQTSTKTSNIHPTDGIANEEHRITFNKLDALERISEFMPYLSREAPVFSSVTITCWAISEILIAIFQNRPSIATLAAPVVAFGAIVALHRAYRSYRSYVPEALIGENRKVQEIYRSRTFGWQWSMAAEMLWDRIRPIDAKLDRIRRGGEFVEPKHLSNKEYYKWLKSRPEAIVRLVNAATAQCTQDVPAIIGSAVSEERLKDLKVQNHALADLYATTTRFERDCHAVAPPADFEEVHEMSYGWTDCIRKGIHQFIGIASELGELDKNIIRQLESGQSQLPRFTIRFDIPENLDRFRAQLNRTDPSILEDSCNSIT